MCNVIKSGTCAYGPSIFNYHGTYNMYGGDLGWGTSQIEAHKNRSVQNRSAKYYYHGGWVADVQSDTD